MWSVIFVPHWGQNFFAISGKSSSCMIWRNSFARFGVGWGKRTRNAAANRAIFPESPLVKFAKILTVGKHRSPGVRQKGCRVPPCLASGLGAVAVGDEAVFRPCLAVVAGLAKSLPVGFVPEKIPVATMGMIWSTTVAGVSRPCWRQRTQNGWCSRKDLLAVCQRFV